MAQCTVCAHPEREAIDHALIDQEPFRIVAKRFGVTTSAVYRHRQAHLGRDVMALPYGASGRQGIVTYMEVRRAQALAHAVNLIDDAEAVLGNVRKLFDACGAWLADPDCPDRYDLTPRANEIIVRYTVVGANGQPVPARATLSALLEKAFPDFAGDTGEGEPAPAQENLSRGTPLGIEHVEFRNADPRELLLKSARRMECELRMLHQLLAQLAEADSRLAIASALDGLK